MVAQHKKDARDLLAVRVNELREELQGRDTAVLAANTGAAFTPTEAEQGEFRLHLWHKEVVLRWPAFTAYDAQTSAPLETFDLAMLAYYFYTADGTPPAGTWISFSELPDGKFYTAAFQGYTGNELAKAFGNDLPAFAAAAEKLGGRREMFADIAYAFRALPKVSLLAAGWAGDEDFPPSYRVLFDAHSAHQTTADACAILGSRLTRRLIQSKVI